MNGAGGRQPQGADALPATGAWRPGDPAGRRQFTVIAHDRPFVLEGGGQLRDVTLAYETWGTLDEDATNAVLVCHALTGDAHVAGRMGHGHPTSGWWDDLVGPGRAIDTDRYFVVCVNVLGGCQGSTGPASVDPDTGRPYGSTFPVVTIRDMVRTQAAVADHLGIERWLAVVGGSMGGMQVLEWAAMFPPRVRAIVPIATCAAATAQQIAYSAVQRAAIALDPAFNGGDYYDAPDGQGPHRGLATARQLAQITYRSDRVFSERFGRGTLDELDFSLWQRFDVEGYLDYHGTKLVRRFDANSYLRIAKAMDLHDIGRDRGGVHRALDRVRVPVLAMSIDSDALYLPYQQQDIVDGVRAHGGHAELVTINSPDGHDAFLLATDQIAAALTPFLDEVHKTDA
jgi:homoserine O-acetyltransferase/O-succinyltransferase